MLERILEPEVMDTREDAIEYDSMDFLEVNTVFAERALEIGPREGVVLDVGTGTARIPILMLQRQKQLRIVGVDLSKNMLLVGEENVRGAGLGDRIRLEKADAKALSYERGIFDMVISNSIVHHLPDPLPFFKEIQRVLRPGGAILIRDLLRPENMQALEALVGSVGPDYDEHQRRLFRDSLHASFTLEEVHSMARSAGFSDVSIYQSSDRHWTLERPFQHL